MRSKANSLQIPTAEVFEPLLAPARYKGAWGGRGSAKSHFFAGLMVEDHFANPGFRSVCIREVQKTLQQSAKRLIEDKLAEFRLGEAQGFKVFREVIETPGDGLIIFQGMQDHTADSIKSLEGFDRAWVEEAQSLSHRSLTLLRPTLRKEGSQIWFSWNPRNEFDAVDQFLRKKPPEGALVVRSNWSDNPWFTATLEDERLHDKEAYPELYDNVWEGAYSDDASQIFIPARLVLEAEKSTVEPSPSATVVWGLDVGRQGDDSALCKRRGNALLEPVKAFHRPDTMQVVSFVLSELLQTAHHAPDRFPKMLVIDANGMGWGVFDRLRQIQRENTRHAEGVDIPNLKNLRIVDLNVSKAPTIKQAVRSLRDELWYKGREWLESGIANLPDDAELRRELTSVRYAEDSSGRIQIESKKDAAKRGIDSWNRADAFLLTFGGGADSVTASKNSYGAPINYPKTRGYV